MYVQTISEMSLLNKIIPYKIISDKFILSLVMVKRRQLNPYQTILTTYLHLNMQIYMQIYVMT